MSPLAGPPLSATSLYGRKSTFLVGQPAIPDTWKQEEESLQDDSSEAYRVSRYLGTESTGVKAQMRLRCAHWEVKKMGIRAE